MCIDDKVLQVALSSSTPFREGVICCESETTFTKKAQKGHLALDKYCLLRRRSSSCSHHLSRHHLGKEGVTSSGVSS